MNYIEKLLNDDYESKYTREAIFWTAGDPVNIMTEMLEKLKKKGLLE